MDGKRLAEIRKKRRKKQRELADELGVYPDTISRYERGIIEPPDDMKIRICRFLDVKLDYLVGLTDKFEPLIEQPQQMEEEEKGLYFQSKEELAKEFVNFLVFEEKYDDQTKELLHHWSLLNREQKQKLLQQLKRGI